MSPQEPLDSTTCQDLPPYSAILVVDAKGFSDTPGAQQSAMNANIVQVLAAAFSRAGLADAWRDGRFPAHTGDGYIVGLAPERLPCLIDPFLRMLQAELRDWDRRRPSGQPRLRLRASMHVGPLPETGIGKPMTDTHRLLDSDVVRRTLSATHEDVTFLGVIVSQRIFENVVATRYTTLHEAQFVEVEASARNFAARAYLHVPEPSGGLLRSGVSPTGPAPAATAAPEAARGPSAGMVFEAPVHNLGPIIGGNVGRIDYRPPERSD